MASLFCIKHSFLLASFCTFLYFTQNISAQTEYVDFLSRANDRLTVDLLWALAGNFITSLCGFDTIEIIITC